MIKVQKSHITIFVRIHVITFHICNRGGVWHVLRGNLTLINFLKISVMFITEFAFSDRIFSINSKPSEKQQTRKGSDAIIQLF